MTSIFLRTSFIHFEQKKEMSEGETMVKFEVKETENKDPSSNTILLSRSSRL